MAGYLDHYLQQLEAPLTDPQTIEIAINGDARIWTEKIGDVFMAPLDGISMTPNGVTDLANQIANKATQSLTSKTPMISTTVNFGGVTLRAQAIIAPAAASGTVLAFRLFRQREADEQPKKFDFLRQQNLSMEEERLRQITEIREMATDAGMGGNSDRLLEACVHQKLNVIISGGTSTGKTELARRMVWMIPTEERLVLIEDSAELLPHHSNHVSLIASRDEKSERSAEKLLQATLRLRPDRIILGELRDSAALTFLESINTGHAGSFTTIHAESGRKAMDRLALLVMNTGTQLNYSEILRYLRGSIDVVIQTGREGSRRGIMETYFPALDDKLI